MRGAVGGARELGAGARGGGPCHPGVTRNSAKPMQTCSANVNTYIMGCGGGRVVVGWGGEEVGWGGEVGGGGGREVYCSVIINTSMYCCTAVGGTMAMQWYHTADGD